MEVLEIQARDLSRQKFAGFLLFVTLLSVSDVRILVSRKVCKVCASEIFLDQFWVPGQTLPSSHNQAVL